MNIQSNSKNVDTDGTNAAEPERKEPAEKEETADEADFVSGVSEVSEEEPRQEGKIKKKKKRGSEAMAWIRDIVAAVLIAVIIAQFIQPTNRKRTFHAKYASAQRLSDSFQDGVQIRR